MKRKTLIIISIIVWLVLSGVIGFYISQGLHYIGATFITVKDIIACYVFSLLGMAAFCLWIYLWLESKIND